MSDDDLWTIEGILKWTRGYFAGKGIESARLDAEVLLAHVLGRDRVYLYTHFDKPLDEGERAAFRALVKRRGGREPVAHLVGHREFFSRHFVVTPAVLVPRPETEHLVETVLAWSEVTDMVAPRILDIGTGSGNIAVALACELPEASVVACDISEAALAVAQQNVEAHGVGDRVELVASDLFGSVSGTYDVIVTNPPYVDAPARAQLQPEVRDYEPELALFAGENGLDVIERLCPHLVPYLSTPGLFVCEIDPRQYERVAELLRANGDWSRIEPILDLQQLRRAVRAER